MRPKKHRTTGSNDLFRARLDQIINMKHELVLLAGKVDWDRIDGEIAPLYSENGRPGIATRFMIGLLLLKQIYGLSDEGVCERWVHDPISSTSPVSTARGISSEVAPQNSPVWRVGDQPSA
jgi:transposase, IS5 family